jgi:hypothetical protein
MERGMRKGEPSLHRGQEGLSLEGRALARGKGSRSRQTLSHTADAFPRGRRFPTLHTLSLPVHALPSCTRPPWQHADGEEHPITPGLSEDQIWSVGDQLWHRCGLWVSGTARRYHMARKHEAPMLLEEK